MNPMAILGLLGSLYEQIAQISAENASLRDQVESLRLRTED